MELHSIQWAHYEDMYMCSERSGVLMMVTEVPEQPPG